MTPFGSRLRGIRASHHISLKRLAEEVGTTAQYLSAIELGTKGKGRPPPGLVKRIADFFRLDSAERAALEQAAAYSSLKITLPCESNSSVYRLIHLVVKHGNDLSPRDEKIIEMLLTHESTKQNTEGNKM